MSYQSTVTSLLDAADNTAFIDSVTSTVSELLDSQTADDTTQIHRFMLYHTSPMNIRIGGMMKHLASKQPLPDDPKVLPTLVDTGLMCGWRSVDNSKEQISHLLIGLPFLYAVLVTTKIDKLNDKKYIHSVIGTFIKNDYKASGTNPVDQTQTVSSTKEVRRIFGYLDKLTKSEPIVPIVVDEKKTMSYRQEQYTARWINSDGSLPHASTQTPQP